MTITTARQSPAPSRFLARLAVQVALAGLVSSIVAPSHSVAGAQSATDCAALMKHGIYDKFRTFTSESQYRQIQEFFKNNQFSSSADAQSKAGALGLDIAGVLGVKLNGSTSSSNFNQWSQELLKTTYDVAIQQGMSVQTIDKISDKITDLVAACLTQKGVHAFVIPSADPTSFSFTVDFVPAGSAHPYTNGIILVTPASVAATCTPASYLNAKIDIGPQGRSISCRRIATETVTLTTNTDDGSPIVSYAPFVLPQPTITLTATPASIVAGTSSQLSWNATNANTVELIGIGAVQSNGTMIVTPGTTQQYQAKVVGLNGQSISAFATVTVLPPPPVLTAATVFFHVTDDDKDDDTNVAIAVLCDGGNSVAASSGTYGHWNDNSDHSVGLQVIQSRQKAALIGAGCSIQLTESPKGHDEWHFNWSVQFSFSDGTTTRIDLGAGDVDYNRNVIRKPI